MTRAEWLGMVRAFVAVNVPLAVMRRTQRHAEAHGDCILGLFGALRVAGLLGGIKLVPSSLPRLE